MFFLSVLITVEPARTSSAPLFPLYLIIPDNVCQQPNDLAVATIIPANVPSFFVYSTHLSLGGMSFRTGAALAFRLTDDALHRTAGFLRHTPR
jgi:hypothetical protein